MLRSRFCVVTVVVVMVIYEANAQGQITGSIDAASAQQQEQPYSVHHGPRKTHDEIAQHLGTVATTEQHEGARRHRRDGVGNTTGTIGIRRFRWHQKFSCPSWGDIVWNPSITGGIPCPPEYKPDPEHPWAAAGHVFTVDNPLRMLSVVEPRRPGGCSQRKDVREDFRAPVQVTAAAHKCTAAINAGFFNVNSGECYGNLVSNGYKVQTGPANVNFGVRKSGKIEIGYINASDVEENDSAGDPFMQLIAGVLWLVRDGKAYLNTSMGLEYPSTQGGTLEQFRYFQSARVAIGHDKHGVVKVVQVDGKTRNRGLSLDEFVELLLGMGIVNAINLDGGGSSTSVVNGSVVSGSSEDACKEKFPCEDCKEDLQQMKFYCERPVTTVICLKDFDGGAPIESGGNGNGSAHLNDGAGAGKLSVQLMRMQDAAANMTTSMIVLVALCTFSIIFNIVQCCCDVRWMCPCVCGCCGGFERPSRTQQAQGWSRLEGSRELLVDSNTNGGRGEGRRGNPRARGKALINEAAGGGARGDSYNSSNSDSIMMPPSDRSTPALTRNLAYDVGADVDVDVDAGDYDMPTSDFGGDSMLDGSGAWHAVN